MSELNSPFKGLASPFGRVLKFWSPEILFSKGEFGVWYDPSDLSTMWQDTGGTSSVTSSGQSVARIDDKSGNGNHLIQATAAKCPVYQNGGGLHWLLFDGVDDVLYSSTDTADLHGSGTSTSFGGFDHTSTTARLEMLLAQYSGFIRTSLLADGRKFLNRRDNTYGTNYEYSLEVTVLNEPTVFTGISKSTILNIRKNGVAGAGIIPSGTGFMTTQAIGFGGHPTSTGYEFGGKVFSVVHVNRETTAQEVSDCETHIAKKSGVLL